MKIIKSLNIIVTSLFIIIVLVLNQFVYSQTNYTDSLFNEYNNSSGSKHLSCILKLAETNDISYSTVKNLSDEALTLCTNDTSLDLETAFYVKGLYFFNMNTFDSAEYYFNKILYLNTKVDPLIMIKSYYYSFKIFSEMKFDLLKGKQILSSFLNVIEKNPSYLNCNYYYYSAKAEYYSRLNKIDSALLYCKISDSLFTISNKKNDIFFHDEIKINMSYQYFVHGDFAKSALLLMSLNDEKLSLKHKAIKQYLMILLFEKFGLGSKYQQDFYLDAINNFKQLEDSYYVLWLEIMKSKLYIDEKKYDTAKSILINTLNENEKLNDKVAETNIYYLLFLLNKDLHNYKKSITYAKKALELSKKTKLLIRERQINLELADEYSLMGELAKADSIYSSIRESILSEGFFELTQQFNKKYAFHLMRKNNFKSAFKYLEKYSVEQDSSRIIQNKSKFEMFYVIYKTKEKEKENTILKQKLIIERQQKEQQEGAKKNAVNYLIITGVLLLLAIILLITYQQNVKHKRKLNIEIIRRIEQENRLLEQEKTQAANKLKSHNELIKVMNNQLLYQALISSKLISELKMLKDAVNHDTQIKIQTVLAEFKSFSASQNWINFEQNFIKVFPGLQEIIKNEVPDLSVGDFRMICFIVMRLSNSEISMITMQSNSSLRSATFRLRKRFNVETNDELLEKLNHLTGGKLNMVITQPAIGNTIPNQV